MGLHGIIGDPSVLVLSFELELTSVFMDRYEGLRRSVGERGVHIGGVGRLWNVSIVRGVGVLDGRGTISMGKP